MRSTTDTQAFKQALAAAAHAPFFPDWEFNTLFGLERTEVASIAESFSSATAIAGDVELALSNAVANLVFYPHRQDAIWLQWLTVTPVALLAALERWRAAGNEA